MPTFMVNFGCPYNDIVICKDSTDYLTVYRYKSQNLVEYNSTFTTHTEDESS